MTIILGAMAGSLVGIVLILLKKHQAEKHIPFGPFLAFGALIAIFYGQDVSAWYFGML